MVNKEKMWNRKSVDIIIPIYNAYEDLTKCLDSIYKHTNLEQNRLILINDNSSDERIRPFLEQQRNLNVIVFHNESNKGFSNNVNIGMQQSGTNDVILLNSDTVVTERWVEKISECAYSDEGIGTVTPLSNNATLCSVPEFCEENILPDYLSIDQAGEIVERCSLRKYPRITVAHGFCMFIKREVIDTIGYFDAETFEKGYGEENDFCNRAEQAGYHHVMCDDTYIYHSGTKSFVSKEKEKYIMLHDKILREWYPEQMHLNDVHVRDNPNGFVGENVGIYFDLENGKKNILYVLQSDFRKGATDNIGGTQFHVRDLELGLRNEYNIFVAARNGEYLNLTAYYGEKEREFRFYIGKRSSIYEFKSKILEELWRNILSAFHINLVHVHHVISMSFDIFYVAQKYNIPIVFTFHDLLFVCPSIMARMEILNDDCCIGKNCDCGECLNKCMGITDKIDYINIWRKKCAEVLKMCKAVIIPDEGVSSIILSYYPFLEDKLQIIEHGYNNKEVVEREIKCSCNVLVMYEKVEKEGTTYKVEGWTYLSEKQGNTGEKIYLQIRNGSNVEELVPAAKVSRRDVIIDEEKSWVGFSCVVPQRLLDGGSLQIRVALEEEKSLTYSMDSFKTPNLPVMAKKKLNVAFIGGLNNVKGGRVVNTIVDNYAGDVNWYVFGGIGVDKLKYKKKNNLVKTGYYMPEDLPTLLKLHEIDVIGILSMCPETYAYTLTEAVLNGIPVIVTDIGALGRRVKQMKCGWIIPLEHAKHNFLKIIKELTEDQSQLEQYKGIIETIQFPDISQMTSKYKQIYEGLWNEKIIYSKVDYEMILEGCNIDKWGRKGMQTYAARGGNISESVDGYYKFKRYLQNNHSKLYVLLRRVKGYIGKRG